MIPNMRKAQDDDEAIRDIKKLLERGLSYQDYVLRSGLIYRCSQGYEQIVVPRAMQNEVIKSAHEKGHFAAKRTEEEVKREFFIPDLHIKVERCLANCLKCVLINKKSGKQEGYLHSLNKGDLPLHTYHVDHLGPLESTHKDYKYILAVIDALQNLCGCIQPKL